MASRSKKCAKKSPLKQSCASQCVLDTDDASSVDTVISSSTDDSGALDSVPYSWTLEELRLAYQDLSDLIESGVKEHDRELYQKLGPVLSELRCILAQIYDPDSEEEEKQPSQSRSGDRSE